MFGNSNVLQNITTIDMTIIIMLIITIFASIYLYLYNKKETFENKLKSISESFIVSDANDQFNYENIVDATLKNTLDNFNNASIDNPAKNDIVNYDINNNIQMDVNPTGNIVNYDTEIGTNNIIRIDDKTALSMRYKQVPPVDQKEKQYITAVDVGMDNPYPMIGCANSSINDRYKTGPKRILPYQIACGHPNKLTSENYYKTFYKAEKIPIEDYRIKGSNYMDYTDSVNPLKLGVRILSYDTKGLPEEDMKYKNTPTGFGYAFHNTPAMAMP